MYRAFLLFCFVMQNLHFDFKACMIKRHNRGWQSSLPCMGYSETLFSLGLTKFQNDERWKKRVTQVMNNFRHSMTNHNGIFSFEIKM